MDHKERREAKFDRSVQDKLQNLEFGVPEHLWDTIESEIPPQKSFFQSRSYWSIFVLCALFITSLSSQLGEDPFIAAPIDENTFNSIPIGAPGAVITYIPSRSLEYAHASSFTQNVLDQLKPPSTLPSYQASNDPSRNVEPIDLSVAKLEKSISMDKGTDGKGDKLSRNQVEKSKSIIEPSVVPKSNSRKFDAATNNFAKAISPIAVKEAFDYEADLSLVIPQKDVLAPTVFEQVAWKSNSGFSLGFLHQIYYSAVLNASNNLNKHSVNKIRTSGAATGLRIAYDFNKYIGIGAEYAFTATFGQKYGVKRNINLSQNNAIDLNVVQIPVYLKIHRNLPNSLTGKPIRWNNQIGLQYSRVQSGDFKVNSRSLETANFLNKEYIGFLIGTEFDLFLSPNIYLTMGIRYSLNRDLAGPMQMLRSTVESNYHSTFGVNAGINLLLR